MTTYRVQEYIKRSGRVHVFSTKFDSVRAAFISLRSKARIAQLEYRAWDYRTDPPTYQDRASLQSDRSTYIDVVSEGGAHRHFTIVTKRNGPAIEFGHLLKVKQEVVDG